MKKVLRLQKVSDKKGGKPTPKPLTYSVAYSKAHALSYVYSRTHHASDNGGSRFCMPE